MRARLTVLALAIAMLVTGLPVSQAADPVFPALTGRIVDEANLLTPQDEAELTAQLQSLEEKSSDQVVVVTLKSLQGFPIEDFGVRLGRQWGIGQAGKDNGVLLIVAPNERKVRIEVGRRLEPLLTDAMSRIIIENAILPGFRRGDFADGIRAGVRDINDVLLGDTEAVKQRARGMHQAPETDWVAIAIIVLWIAIVAYSLYQQNQQARQLPPSARRRRGRRFGNDGIIILPGGSGNWSGGSGGGGWSGGGGSFGGGGASGSW